MERSYKERWKLVGAQVDKPIVRYCLLASPLVVGEGAMIMGVLDHPAKLKGEMVYTSDVVRVGEKGEFETRNTVYRLVPVEK